MRQNMYSWAVSRQKSYNTPDGSDDKNELNHDNKATASLRPVSPFLQLVSET